MDVADEVAAKVRQIIAEKLDQPAEAVTDSADFIENLGADSLDTVELAMALEDEFEIVIEDNEAAEIRTVGEVIELVRRKVAEKAAAG